MVEMGWKADIVSGNANLSETHHLALRENVTVVALTPLREYEPHRLWVSPLPNWPRVRILLN